MTPTERVIPRFTQYLFAGIGGAVCAAAIIGVWSFPSGFGLWLVMYAIPVGFVLGPIAFGVGNVICAVTPTLPRIPRVILAALGAAAAATAVAALVVMWIGFLPLVTYAVVVFIGTFLVALGSGIVYAITARSREAPRLSC